MSDDARRGRIGAVVAGVLRQALADAGARRILLLDDGSAQARLALEWCAAAAGIENAIPVRGETFVGLLGEQIGPGAPQPDEILGAETARLEARLEAARGEPALLAHPANKTALVLAGLAAPPEPLLPLGDLYASEVEALAGGWSAPARVRELAGRVGGIERLDALLRAHFDERRPLREALAPLPEDARRRLEDAVEAARFGRRRLVLVPKLGARTLGVDLFA